MDTSTIPRIKNTSSTSLGDGWSGVLRKVRSTLKSGNPFETSRVGPEANPLEKLLALDPADRFAKLRDGGTVYRGRSLGVELLAKAEALLAVDAAEADGLAELALFVAERLDPRTVPAVLIFDYQARAWITMGIARTTAGALPQASMALQLAGCLLSSGSGDVKIQATFLQAKARLYKARGETELARQANLRASVMLASLSLSRACS